MAVGGLTLVLFPFLPIHLLPGISWEGPPRVAYLALAEASLEAARWGTLLVLLFSILLTFLFSGLITRWGRTVVAWLCKPELASFALAVALLSFVLSAALGAFLYEGLFTNVDEMAMAIHARYLAGGNLAGPQLSFPEAWLIPNTLMTGEGWVSQYPPAHLVVMAVFYRLGIPRLLGPVMFGVMVWLLALSAERLLPNHRGEARVTAGLIAISPFMLLVGGGALSHLTAGAAVAGVLYTALRARDGAWAWAIGVGAAVGIAVTSRPLVGLILGAAIPFFLWAPVIFGGKVAWGFRRIGATIVSGIPFAVLLGLYNSLLFGAPGRLGYVAAYGENHGLGFHWDPWGFLYGLDTALAVTSVDLMALAVRILESPIPLTLPIGVFLLLGVPRPRNFGAILAWAFLPLVGSAFYWFHQPRMLFEAAPAWILLTVISVAGVLRWAECREGWARRLGEVALWAAVVSLAVALLWGAPNRWAGYAWTDEALDRIETPIPPPGTPALVFVHSSWNERISATLQGAGGMRQDSIIPALRRNTHCDLQRYSAAREARGRGLGDDVPLPNIDLQQLSGAPEGLFLASPVEGLWVQTREGEVVSPECRRQAQADRFGGVTLPPLVWQGDLPGDEEGKPLFLRDLGPEKNDEILALFPDRVAYVFSPFVLGGPPELVSYDDGMRVLWGVSP